MAGCRNLVGVLLGLLAVFQLSSAAVEHTVGGSSGWRIMDYTPWVAQQTFRIGDSLLFTWTGTHDVLEVSRASYDSCTATAPITDYGAISPVTVALNGTAGVRYFICGVPGHCASGMKFAANVLPASSSSSPITPTAAPGPKPVEQPGNAAISTFSISSAVVVVSAAAAGFIFAV